MLVERGEPPLGEEIRRVGPHDRERERMARAELASERRTGRLCSLPDPYRHLASRVAAAAPAGIGTIAERAP
jgi:hypothetical protein